jgi:hypothetical protein
MKKAFLLIVLFYVSLVMFSQETEETEAIRQETKEVKQTRGNEIKVRFQFPIFILPEISYERLIKNNFGLGFSTGLWLWQNIDFGEAAVYIMPYGRYYLFKPFFIEANTVLANVRSNSNGTWDTVYGMGLAPGAKFSFGKNWIGEISLGAGFLFGNSYSESGKTAMYYRLGISIGKQF